MCQKLRSPAGTTAENIFFYLVAPDSDVCGILCSSCVSTVFPRIEAPGVYWYKRLGPPACIRGPAFIRGPASINTNGSDPRCTVHEYQQYTGCTVLSTPIPTIYQLYSTEIPTIHRLYSTEYTDTNNIPAVQYWVHEYQQYTGCTVLSTRIPGFYLRPGLYSRSGVYSKPGVYWYKRLGPPACIRGPAFIRGPATIRGNTVT